jgi:hypothetical protein
MTITVDHIATKLTWLFLLFYKNLDICNHDKLASDCCFGKQITGFDKLDFHEALLIKTEQNDN